MNSIQAKLHLQYVFVTYRCGAAHHGIDTVVVGWGYGQADFPDGFTATSFTHAATVDELRGALGV